MTDDSIRDSIYDIDIKEGISIIIGGKYLIQGRLGRGGMSEVFLAVDTRLYMKWAIKRIDCDDIKRNYLYDSIIAEANVLRRIRHEYLVRIADIFKEDNYIYLVMEYVDGICLGDMIKKNPAYVQRHWLDWSIEIAQALSILHSMKPPIIYRDLKPDNIIVRPCDTICLLDFGTAKQLSSKDPSDSFALGTRSFAAPEQFHAISDERSDIYSLGRTMQAMIGSLQNRRAEAIVEKCTQKDPARRFSSASKVENALKRYKHTPIYAVAALILFIVITLALGLFWQGSYLSYRLKWQADEYEKTIESGNEALFHKDYKLAEKYFTNAITLLDSKREEGYLSLVRLYRKIGRTSEGLERIDGYIESDYGCVKDSSKIMYECALAAFYDESDYIRAQGYFVKVDTMQIPEAVYLSEISSYLSSFHTNPNILKDSLRRFREYASSCKDSARRIADDICIARIELAFCDKLDANSSHATLMEAKDIAQDARNLIEQSGSESEYALESLDMLFTIYRLLGQKFPSSKAEFYEKAIDYAKKFIAESQNADGAAVRLKLLGIARMYEELDRADMAIDCYEQSERAYPFQNKNIYVSHLKLLKKIGSDAKSLEKLYNDALKVRGIGSDRDFIKLGHEIKCESR